MGKSSEGVLPSLGDKTETRVNTGNSLIYVRSDGERRGYWRLARRAQLLRFLDTSVLDLKGSLMKKHRIRKACHWVCVTTVEEIPVITYCPQVVH
ncbi:hypothetical protein CDL12_08603 [Handroanthus impetiginosus]|uniref:Uncharacterized protein n=1 Tax=Handroanthus impetiginosus TaxID=429701 RepID=A0A2G9HMR2_9LAMI|nr:hypothetical protein CDL12_08603 [Handroanthus impetiginosus]